MRTITENTQVVIIGGSLVGLSAALFLAARGIRTIVVEKHRGSLAHPRAVGFTELTLEHYRAVGIADQIPQIEPGGRLRRVRVESLSGAWQTETEWTPGEVQRNRGQISPCTGAAIAQDRLEPILRSVAAERGADIRQGLEMLSFDQDDDGVTASVKERDGGRAYAIRAAYMVAADGAGSEVREHLRIVRRGIGHLETIRSVLFRCPEAEHFLARGIQQFEIEQPGFKAFLTRYPDGRWALMFSDDAERSEAQLLDAIHRALGADLPVEIVATGRWELAGRIAERYGAGRVFLAGDAAHQLPPTRGGFGANTGIDDVWNLAWKLALVLEGTSEPTLLETYDEERQPIGWLRHQQTFARPDYRRWAGDALAGEPLYGTDAMELGQLVRSSAIIGAGGDLPPAAEPGAWAGQPGTRAPHLWVEHGGQVVSTVDILSQRFVLLTAHPAWIAAAERTGAGLNIDVETLLLGSDILSSDQGGAEKVFGIGDSGASLIRPDGIVAWRTEQLPEDRDVPFEAVLRRVAALRV